MEFGIKNITIKTIWGESIPLKVQSLSSVNLCKIVEGLLNIGYIQETRLETAA